MIDLDVQTESRMLGLAADACGRARARGADFADVSISAGRQISVAIEGSDIRLAEQHEPCGFSVRAFVGGGMGLSSGDGPPTAELLDSHVGEAVQLARLAGRDPDFADLPVPAEPLVPADALALHDPAIEAVTLADAIGLARDNIDRALALDGGILLNGDVSFSAGWAVLASTTGVAVGSRGTFGELSLFAVARDGDDVGSFSEFTMGRHRTDLNIEPLASKVVDGARKYQHARPCPSRAMTLVLGPLAAFALLGSVAAATSAEAIRRKRSLLAGRLGQRIAADGLTVEDRPLEPRGVYSGPFDSEGAPRRAVVMIDRGLFVEALTNHYNARLAGRPNNGHGTRRGTVSPTNLHVRPGQRPEAELIAEVDDGVYLHSGSLDPDLAGGDISAVLDFACKIDRGKLTYPLAGAMAAGSLLELLGRIDAVSSDYRNEPGMVLPAVRIRDVQFSGSG